MQTGFNFLTAEHAEYAENICYAFRHISRIPRLLSFWLGSGLAGFGFLVSQLGEQLAK